jgi:hypothetical protein
MSPYTYSLSHDNGETRPPLTTYKGKLTILRRILYLDLAKGNPKLMRLDNVQHLPSQGKSKVNETR